MSRYTLVDSVTGKQTFLSEIDLTRNLQLSCILLRGNEHLGIITHRDLVAFARWCAGETLTLLVDEPDLKVTHALSLVDQWLEDQQSVTPEELEAAAGAAARAAQAARAARAAAEAAEAARTAGAAAWAAAGAAWDAGSRGLLYESQAQWLVEHLQSGK